MEKSVKGGGDGSPSCKNEPRLVGLCPGICTIYGVDLDQNSEYTKYIKVKDVHTIVASQI